MSCITIDAASKNSSAESLQNRGDPTVPNLFGIQKYKKNASTINLYTVLI